MIERGEQLFNDLREKIRTLNIPKIRGKMHFSWEKENVRASLQDDRKLYVNESKFAFYMLYFALVILSCKILHVFKRDLENMFGIRKGRVNYRTTATKGEDMDNAYPSIWGAITAFSWLLAPLFSGVLMTIFTWNIIYVDSFIPGVSPPSPLSRSTKNTKMGFQPMIHSNYIIALFSGIIVFVLMLATEWN